MLDPRRGDQVPATETGIEAAATAPQAEVIVVMVVVPDGLLKMLGPATLETRAPDCDSAPLVLRWPVVSFLARNSASRRWGSS